MNKKELVDMLKKDANLSFMLEYIDKVKTLARSKSKSKSKKVKSKSKSKKRKANQNQRVNQKVNKIKINNK